MENLTQNKAYKVFRTQDTEDGRVDEDLGFGWETESDAVHRMKKLKKLNPLNHYIVKVRGKYHAS